MGSGYIWGASCHANIDPTKVCDVGRSLLLTSKALQGCEEEADVGMW